MRRRDIQEWYGTAMTKIKASIIILSLIMIGCKDKKEEDVDCYPKTVYVDNRGNKATMLNDSILVVCTCLEYPEKYKMEVINIKNK
jgi:hypothetical protein